MPRARKRRVYTVYGSIRSYMFNIRNQAGSEGHIRDAFDGVWGVRFHQLQNNMPTPDAFAQQCRDNWASHWQTLPSLVRLHKPSHALKDAHGNVPTAEEFQEAPEVYLEALIDRTVDRFMAPKWKEVIEKIGFPPYCAARWGTNALGIRYVAAAGAANHELNMPSRYDEGLCIPFNARALPTFKADKRKIAKRHHLHYNCVSGYLYVYLGTDISGKPVSESIHRIITLGAHGPRGGDQEVSHTCHNPWCLSPRCMRWCTHLQNMREPRQPTTWAEQAAG